jgi:hypothetical protein
MRYTDIFSGSTYVTLDHQTVERATFKIALYITSTISKISFEQ